MAANAALNLTDCTLRRMAARRKGGGIYAGMNSHIYVLRSHFTSMRATVRGGMYDGGGALFADEGSVVLMVWSTISDTQSKARGVANEPLCVGECNVRGGSAVTVVVVDDLMHR